MKHKLTCILVIALIVSFIPAIIHAQETDRWSVFSTRFCTVFYENDVDMNRINRSISIRFSDLYNPRRYTKKVDFSAKDDISEKLDAIFARVEDILDMYPSKIRVAVNIYKDQDGLNQAYETIFHEPNEAVSFYVYKTNTIYTTEKAISENILAHEMAHCIIDHYFVILPPRKIQEMLAVYADVHLKD